MKNDKRRASRRDPVRRPSGKRTPSAAELREFVRNKGPAFLEDPNITSIGVGYKRRRTPQGEVEELPVVAIQFTVAKKVLESQLESLGTQKIPEEVRVGNVMVPTDVLERTFVPSYKLVASTEKDFRKRRQSPLVPGISVSHPAGTAGTLGLIVYDRTDDGACMLSNWHVLHTPDGALGDLVVQPGPFDDNRVAQNRAGTLVRSHLGAAGDCAIARIEGREFASEIHQLGLAPKRLAEPALGERVIKSGRTTAVTLGRVTRTDVITKIDYEGAVGEQMIGGFEYGPDPDHPPKGGEVSMGGDSGSAVLLAGPNGKPRDILVGLHFAGEGTPDPEDEHGVACYATSVFEKLEIALAPGVATAPPAETQAVGFDRDFLAAAVAFPRLSSAQAKDAYELDGSTELRYTHYSVVLGKARRMARLVAWNVDGASLKAYGRKGLDFKLDPRVRKEFQIGNEAYKSNKLDRGHLARRADLVWGPPAEARQANRDSFYYTNIAPQHQSFNQSEMRGLWGELENAILEEVDVVDLRVSVMAGPVFKDEDMTYRNIRVPAEFWKLVAYVDAADAALHVKAYVLTQEDLLDDVEALDLDEFRLWQVSIAELEQRTALRFPGLAAFDDLAGAAPESVGNGRRPAPREVRSRGQLLG